MHSAARDRISCTSATTLPSTLTVRRTISRSVNNVTPTHRLGNEEDLKGLAVLLASEASRHITGQAIAVDGGASVL